MKTSNNEMILDLYGRYGTRDTPNTQAPLTDKQWADVERWRSLAMVAFVMMFSLFFPPFLIIFGVWWFFNRRSKKHQTNVQSPGNSAGFNNNDSCFIKSPR
jgi:heme/copper-type cytochrome/quinol oxidase subunit 2